MPRLPLDRLLTLSVDYSAIEHRIMAQLGVTPMTEEERRQRLISGRPLVFDQSDTGSCIASALTLSHEDWVSQAASALRATTPDLDLRPGTVARSLLEAAAAHLPIDPHEVTIDHLRNSRLRRLVDGPVERYRGESADVARAREQIRASEDEEVHRRLDEIARDGTWPQEHLQIPMPVRQEVTVLSADPPREPLGFTMHEEVGVAAFNPRAVERVNIPDFEIASNPTVRIEDIRERRFRGLSRIPPDHPFILALIRSQRRRESCPCGCGASNLAQCWNTSFWADFNSIGSGHTDNESIPTTHRRSVWERILED